MNAIQRILLIAGLAALTLGLLLGLLAQNNSVSAMPPTPQNSEYIAADACLTCHSADPADGSLAGSSDEIEFMNPMQANFTATRTINGA